MRRDSRSRRSTSPASLAVGDPVTGRGNAGGLDGAPLSATGTVTSLDETIFVEDEDATIMETLDGVVCFNAPIRPGDSGGPLLEADGRVIGMDTAGALTTATGASADWGCADSDHARDDDREGDRIGNTVSICRVGPPRHPRCRASPRRRRGGCVVTAVTPGGAAATAGLIVGDVITTRRRHSGAVDGRLQSVVMQDRRPGDDVTVVWRDAAGATHTAATVLSAGPPA